MARELGYIVNPVASGLKRGRTLNIGLVAVMNHWYAGAVTSGIDRVAADCGYDFVVMNSGGGSDEELLFERARRLGTRVDGVLILDVAPEQGALARLIESLAVPVVTLGCSVPGVVSVRVDNHEIGGLAAGHLRELGHDEAAVLTFEPPTATAIDNGRLRAAGFAAAFGGSSRVTRLGRTDHSVRRDLILDATDGVSSVFCTSDALAIETVALLGQHGRNVPDDVSVVGVDDHPLSLPLGLTTIAQCPEMMGDAATHLLVELMNGVPASDLDDVLVEVELVRRSTSAEPG